MPSWYRESSWCRGALADDDDGSYRAAANAELYSVGRLNHATGLAFGSTARAFAKQLVSVTKREALRNGDSDEAYKNTEAQSQYAPPAHGASALSSQPSHHHALS